METQPMPLDALSRSPGGVDDFRISAPSEILAYLKQLCNGNAPLNLVGLDSPSCSTTVWAVDTGRGVVSFNVDANDPSVAPLLSSPEVVAVGYLDNIKLQFDVTGLVLARGGRQSALNARLPSEMFRFQRRDAYRVRPLPRSAPTAHLRQPGARDKPMAFRVLDLSIGGCALLLPEDTSPLTPGTLIEGVHIDLDGSSTMRCTLLLHHISSAEDGTGEAPGSRRIGCQMLDIGPDSQRSLQRFIDQTQQRRRHALNP